MMQASEHNIAVVYLAWLPYGLGPFYDFVRSYKRYTEQRSHSLVIIFKGAQNDQELQPYLDLLKEENVDFVAEHYTGGGLDLATYFWITERRNESLFFFLNSQSMLLNDNWLSVYERKFTKSTGAISATASLQSHYTAVFQKHRWKYEGAKGFGYNFRKYKLFVKAIFYWRILFKPFPNPHIRTNAFMISRELMLSLKRPAINNKMDAFRFESGRKGFTQQLLNKKLDVLVIDKEGNTYQPAEWYSSKTFRVGNQENLLVSDNQTRIFDNATPEEKKMMTKLAWGINE